MKRQTSPGTWGNVCIKWRKKVTAKPIILECANLFCLLLVFLIKSMVCGWVGVCFCALNVFTHSMRLLRNHPNSPEKKKQKTIYDNAIACLQRGTVWKLFPALQFSFPFLGVCRFAKCWCTNNTQGVYQQVCPLVARS